MNDQSASDVCRDSGFSLLEMLVVLAIIASVMAVAQPLFRKPPDRLQIETASRNILNALKSARAAAIARNLQTTLTFNLERKTLESSVTSTYTFPRDLGLDLKIAELERESPSRGGIRFFPDGSSTGGDLILTLHNLSSTICVNWLTGIAFEDKYCRK